MADPNTVNVSLFIPTRGSDVGVWDSPLNSDFNSIDGFIGGVQTISLISGSSITLTAPSGSITPSGGPTQAQNAVLRLTGTLTADTQIVLPLPGYMIIDNSTVGNFTIVLRGAQSTGSSGQIIATQGGSVQHIYNDGLNVKFVNLQPVGTYLDYAGSAVPRWITNCSVPPFLNCDGSTFSGTTFPQLAAILGGTTLPDLRGVSRATLNQGTGRITSAGSGIDGNTIFSIGGSQAQTLSLSQLPTNIASNGINTITVSAQTGGNNIPVTTGNVFITGSSGSINIAPASSNGTWTSVSSLAGTQNIGVSSSNTGGGAHPIMGPTTISGITLIRAA